MSEKLKWIRVSDVLPPEGVVVNTKIHDSSGRRNEQRLIREGALWWFPDKTAYVYYSPTHWVPVH